MSESLSPSEYERPQISLEDVLDTERVIPPEYQRLIAQEVDSYFFTDTAYSDRWGRVLNDQQTQPEEGSLESHFLAGAELVKQHVAGKIIVDIGGGYYSSGIAKKLGAAGYICVDLAFSEDNPPKSNPLVAVEDYGDHVSVCADALDFCSRLKDASVCFMLNGTDIFLCGVSDYTISLVKEIERATVDGGLVFGIGRPSIDEIINSRIRGHSTSFVKAMSKDGYIADVTIDSFIFLKPENDEEDDSRTLPK